MKIPFSIRLKEIRSRIKAGKAYQKFLEKETRLKRKTIRVMVDEKEFNIARNTPRSASGYVHGISLSNKEAFDLYKIFQQLFNEEE